MYLCAVVLLAVIIALLRGGNWQNLLTFRFRKDWLVFVAIVLQLLIFNPLWEKYVQGGIITSIIYVISIMIVIAFIIVNLNITGLRVLGLGIISNSIAIISNGGFMPSKLEALKNVMSAERINVLESGSAAYNVVLITKETKFKYLCDNFYVPHVNVYSAGDVLIALGAFIAIQQIMLHRKGANVIKSHITMKGG